VERIKGEKGRAAFLRRFEGNAEALSAYYKGLAARRRHLLNLGKLMEKAIKEMDLPAAMPKSP
jgi:hypothetical protein